jgi:CRISPR-associated protein (TIGR03986 family)
MNGDFTTAINLLEENLKLYVKNENEFNERERLKPKKERKLRNSANPYKDHYDKVKCGKKKNGSVPVWYNNFNGTYYLAPAQLSRNVYTKKPSDFLKKLKLQRCESRESLCEACSLFGFVSDKGGDSDGDNALGSRIRVSDAVCEAKGRLVDKPELLPILSSPRLSSFEFYLKHAGDFYHADTEGVELAGRKAYWHNPTFTYDQLQSKLTKKPKMASKMQWAKKDTRFSFEVFFEDVSATELKKLIYSLNFGSNDKTDEHCHKLGHGKPLGFGSVKITVDEVITREFNKDTGTYHCGQPNPSPVFLTPAPFKCENLTNILKVANFQTIKNGKLLDYPRGETGRIFDWFSQNRQIEETFEKNKFYKKLPEVSKDTQELPRNPRQGQPAKGGKK